MSEINILIARRVVLLAERAKLLAKIDAENLRTNTLSAEVNNLKSQRDALLDRIDILQAVQNKANTPVPDGDALLAETDKLFSLFGEKHSLTVERDKLLTDLTH